MSMKIKSIRINNWRSIKSVTIAFQDLMVFIGQNNHGKSNVLSALLFFFGELKNQDADFNGDSKQLFVEVTFWDLDKTDQVTFKKYITLTGEITVRKNAYLGGAFDYKGYIENPVDEWLKEINAGAYTSRELAQPLAFYDLLPNAGRITKQNIIDAQIKYIEENRDKVVLVFQPEETNFLGLKSVAKGIFGDIYFIPAIKDASEDFSSKEASAFGKLFSKIIDSLSESNPAWKETKDKLAILFGALNRLDKDGKKNAVRPQELQAFEDSLAQELKSWSAEIDVEIIPPNMDDVFRANTQVWVNDGVRTDIRRKGHGLQRALTFALIKVISESLKKEREEEDLDAAGNRTASASTFFILEEPELYLHPQAQRALFHSLVELSESKNQVLICTHASTLIDVEKYKSICIVKKDSLEQGTTVCQCTDELFTGDKKKDFNLSYWINPDRSELFFAKKVILVEGPTDKTIIPLLAKRLNIFKYEYTLIDCGSKDSIPLYCLLLNKFRIPYIIAYDLDHQKGKSADAIASADRSNKIIDEALNVDIGWKVVFTNDIEEEIGIVAGNKSKPYEALAHISNDDFMISRELKEKIETLYQ